MAFYALDSLAHAQKGQSILIHADQSPQSEAVVRVSLFLGLNVFVLTEKDSDGQDLSSKIPQLSGKVSRSLYDKSTIDKILQANNDKGVNIVFNPSSVNKLQESLRILARNGFYLQYGKSNEKVNSSVVNKLSLTVYNNVSEMALGLSAEEKEPLKGFFLQAFQVRRRQNFLRNCNFYLFIYPCFDGEYLHICR